MWDLPGPGLEPVSPALAGGFLTTAPPGKSSHHFFISFSLHGDSSSFLKDSSRKENDMVCLTGGEVAEHWATVGRHGSSFGVFLWFHSFMYWTPLACLWALFWQASFCHSPCQRLISRLITDVELIFIYSRCPISPAPRMTMGPVSAPLSCQTPPFLWREWNAWKS